MLYYTIVALGGWRAVPIAVKSSCRLQRPVRRAKAALGVLALLLQAMLFAWHHHQLPFSSRTAAPLALTAPGPDTPPAVDRDCEICFSLSHHGAVPVALFAAAQPEARAPRRIHAAATPISPVPYFLFQPRAPPRS